MNYISLPYMDTPVSVFDVCQAHAQLESDYNVGGIVWERPSNRRRNASTGYQLSRMKYSSPYRWVNICDPDDEDTDVSDIYLINVLRWALPTDTQMQACINARFTPKFIASLGSKT